MPEVPHDAAATFVALEEAALAHWAKGGPSGFLAICYPAVTWFDPRIPRRIDGLSSVGARQVVQADRLRVGLAPQSS